VYWARYYSTLLCPISQTQTTDVKYHSLQTTSTSSFFAPSAPNNLIPVAYECGQNEKRGFLEVKTKQKLTNISGWMNWNWNTYVGLEPKTFVRLQTLFRRFLDTPRLALTALTASSCTPAPVVSFTDKNTKILLNRSGWVGWKMGSEDCKSLNPFFILIIAIAKAQFNFPRAIYKL
jgi:hypothetical protein